MDILIIPFLLLLKSLFGIATIIIIADVILGWLVTANIININNSLVYSFLDTVSKLSRIFLMPLRMHIPLNIGMIDFAPVLFLLIIKFLELAIDRILIRFV